MAFPFTSDYIYVRESYLVYYDLINACLANGEIWFVSLTGTPGIGKSVFYVYFFERYRAENPEKTIIVASFDKARKLKECKKYPRNGGAPTTHSCIPQDDDEAVHLYDGPPSSAPIRRKMVCFTSPNHAWLYNNERDETHRVLNFPLWSWDELEEANDLCNLCIPVAELKRRFQLFGGSARYCLTKHKKWIQRGSDGLQAKISSVDTFDKLAMCLKNETSDNDFSHQLFHSVPQIDDEFPFVDFEQRVICSNQALKAINGRIREKSDARRSDLISSIRGVSKFAAFRGSLFEEHVHDTLRNGGSFKLEALCNGVELPELQLSPKQYQQTKIGQESVDGVLVQENIVYLFQVTIALTHSITAHGMLQTLKSIGKFDDYRDGRAEVRLVFVVSKDNEELKSQKIRCEKPISWSSPVTEMRHIRRSWLEEIRNLHGDISAYGLWELAREDPKIGERFSPALRDFHDRIVNQPLNAKTVQTAQYRLVLLGFDEDNSAVPNSLEGLLNEIRLLTERNRTLEMQLLRLTDPKEDGVIND